jgi:hypothetical protein
VSVSENSRTIVQPILSGLDQEYDGKPKPVGVSVSPADLKVIVYYGSSTVAPTAVGSYGVFASVESPAYQGTASGTLVIRPGRQTVTFPEVASATVGGRISLQATSSSGLPVSFAVISGPARLEGGILIPTARGVVVLRASQAGNGSYLPATEVDRSVVIGSGGQTISFEIASTAASGASLPLKATATSGLPVTFEVVSGPGRIEAGALLLGAAGEVIVRATQAGDANYSPAPAVERRIRVASGPEQLFLADVVDASSALRRGRIAGSFPSDGRAATLLVLAPEVGLQGAFSPQVGPDGSFAVQVPLVGSSSLAESGPARAAFSPGDVTLRGSVRDGQLAIDIADLGLRAAGRALPPAGSGASVAGSYRADSLGSLQGTVHAIVFPSGETAVLVRTSAGATFGGVLGLGTNSSFSGALIGPSGSTEVKGSLVAESGGLSGSFTLPGGVPTDFSGISNAAPRTGRLINLSSLARSGAGDATLIAGFVVEGSGPRQFLIRGIGPGLTAFGVGGVSSNPRVRLYQGASLQAENDDWHENPAAKVELAAASGRIGAFPLTEGSADAALLRAVAPGAYTVHVESAGTEGVALAEIYDAGGTAAPSLANLSVRSTLEPSGGVLTAGFVIDGNSPRRVLIRAIGPGLAQFGVQGVVVDPSLTVRREAVVVAENDNWISDESSGIAAAARAAGAFTLPVGSKDAVLLLALPPGAYTAQMTGVTGGVGMIEVYQLP